MALKMVEEGDALKLVSTLSGDDVLVFTRAYNGAIDMECLYGDGIVTIDGDGVSMLCNWLEGGV